MYKILRLLDIMFAVLGFALLWPVLLVLYIFGLFGTGSSLYRQERVGRYQKPFVIVKFRTMRLETASLPSHLVSGSSVTKLGSFLRQTKLDELPQLWNVLLGDMSLVGPRPSLFSQYELILARSKLDVYSVRPGITGLAQVKGIDMSTPELLAQVDAKMISTMNFTNYFKFIIMSISGRGTGDRVKI